VSSTSWGGQQRGGAIQARRRTVQLQYTVLELCMAWHDVQLHPTSFNCILYVYVRVCSQLGHVVCTSWCIVEAPVAETANRSGITLSYGRQAGMRVAGNRMVTMHVVTPR